jgi:EAL and modified HD-GYP domain-containing signal transduction protein
MGFRFALDDFDHRPINSDLLPLADYIKIDIQALGLDKTSALVKTLKDSKAKLIAEKVETKTEYKFCKELGFHFFQGYYFAHQNPHRQGDQPAHATVLTLLNKVRNRDVKTSKMASRMCASFAAALHHSVGFACPRNPVHKSHFWLPAVVSLADATLATAGNDSTPPALMKTAITRGRLTELLGQDYLEKSDRDNLFIVGIFSLLDAMLEMPMSDVLEKLYLPETISDALLSQQGIYGPFRPGNRCEC